MRYYDCFFKHASCIFLYQIYKYLYVYIMSPRKTASLIGVSARGGGIHHLHTSPLCRGPPFYPPFSRHNWGTWRQTRSTFYSNRDPHGIATICMVSLQFVWYRYNLHGIATICNLQLHSVAVRHILHTHFVQVCFYVKIKFVDYLLFSTSYIISYMSPNTL